MSLGGKRELWLCVMQPWPPQTPLWRNGFHATSHDQILGLGPGLKEDCHRDRTGTSYSVNTS